MRVAIHEEWRGTVCARFGLGGGLVHAASGCRWSSGSGVSVLADNPNITVGVWFLADDVLCVGCEVDDGQVAKVPRMEREFWDCGRGVPDGGRLVYGAGIVLGDRRLVRRGGRCRAIGVYGHGSRASGLAWIGVGLCWAQGSRRLPAGAGLTLRLRERLFGSTLGGGGSLAAFRLCCHWGGLAFVLRCGLWLVGVRQLLLG